MSDRERILEKYATRQIGYAEMNAQLAALPPLRDGEPCSHPGCLHHVSHPCDGCGRIAGTFPARNVAMREL